MYQISKRHVLQGLGAGFLVANTPSIFTANPTTTFVVPFNPGWAIDSTTRIITNAPPKVCYKNSILIKNIAETNGAAGLFVAQEIAKWGALIRDKNIHLS